MKRWLSIKEDNISVLKVSFNYISNLKRLLLKVSISVLERDFSAIRLLLNDVRSWPFRRPIHDTLPQLMDIPVMHTLWICHIHCDKDWQSNLFNTQVWMEMR